MRKSKFILIFFVFLISILSAGAGDSFIKLDKLKSIIVKGKKEGNNIKNSLNKPENILPPKKIAPFGIPLNQNIGKKLKETNENKENSLSIAGIIFSKKYRAVLIDYNGDFVFLKEGEEDEFSGIKVLKISAKKVIIFLNNKKKELEVENE